MLPSGLELIPQLHEQMFGSALRCCFVMQSYRCKQNQSSLHVMLSLCLCACTKFVPLFVHVLQFCRSARLVVYEYRNSIVKCVLLCHISAIRIWQMQVRSTAHNINTAGRHTWSTAWQGISRPSSLLSFFKKDQQEDTWTDGNAEGGESGQRQPLVRYNNEYEQNGTEPT